jgi:hypothetical protein
MNAPTSWLFADNSRYSNRSRLLFIGLSFAIGIATFLLYLAVWYACRTRSQRAEDPEAGAASPGPERRGMSDAAIAALPTFKYEIPTRKVSCAPKHLMHPCTQLQLTILKVSKKLKKRLCVYIVHRSNMSQSFKS